MDEFEKTVAIRHPQRRHELLWYLFELASPSEQHERWILQKSRSPGQMEGFDFVVHFFFDDTDLGEHTDNELGYILIDELEVSAVGQVSKALNTVLKAVVGNQPDAVYLARAEWQRVIAAAIKAYRLIRPRLKAEGDTILPPELAP